MEALNEHAGAILRRFDDNILSVRRAAVHALAQLPPPLLAAHTEALVQRLRDPEWTMRAAILEALGTLEHRLLCGERIFPSLIEALEDAFDGVRAAAVGVLGSLEPAHLAANALPIVQLTQHRKGAVRVAAVSILDALSPSDLNAHVEAIAKLIQHPADTNRFVRIAALQVLAKLGEEALAPYQQPILRLADDDGDPEVKDAACEALLACDPTGALVAHLSQPPPSLLSPSRMTSQSGMAGANPASPARRTLSQQMATSSNQINQAGGSPAPSPLKGGSGFAPAGAAPALASARRGSLSHRSGGKLTGRGGESAIAPVMSKLPAQEPFRDGPSLSRHPAPARMLGHRDYER